MGNGPIGPGDETRLTIGLFGDDTGDDGGGEDGGKGEGFDTGALMIRVGVGVASSAAADASLSAGAAVYSTGRGYGA